MQKDRTKYFEEYRKKNKIEDFIKKPKLEKKVKVEED